MRMVGAQQRVTETAKDFEFLIIWCDMIQLLIGRKVIENSSRKSVDSVYSSKEGINPIST
jgi:hypothetical protein